MCGENRDQRIQIYDYKISDLTYQFLQSEICTPQSSSTKEIKYKINNST